MNAHVNLLPPELALRRRVKRTNNLTVVGVAVWLVVLGGLFVIKNGQVADAMAERDAAQAQVASLQTDIAALDEYAVLAARLDAREAMLTAAMTDEVSWARVLNDMSLAFPADASMTSLTAALLPVVEPEPGAIKAPVSLGDLAFNGYSVDELAPGVEGVLIEFDSARGFVDSYLNTAARTERGATQITDFSGNVQLDESTRTGRYDDGLPTEDMQ